MDHLKTEAYRACKNDQYNEFIETLQKSDSKYYITENGEAKFKGKPCSTLLEPNLEKVVENQKLWILEDPDDYPGVSEEIMEQILISSSQSEIDLYLSEYLEQAAIRVKLLDERNTEFFQTVMLGHLDQYH